MSRTAAPPRTLRFADFDLDLAGPELRRAGRVVALRPKSLALICHLAGRPRQLVRKEDLVDAVWGDTAVSDATLARTLFDAREALGDDSKKPRFIETVHRLGFRFLVDVDDGRAPAATSAKAPVAPDVFGRETELRELGELRARAVDGQRQTAFLVGEAGIGKTTILEAFLTEAAAARGGSPFLVGRGQSIEHYGQGEAYLPLLDALGGLCRGAAAEIVVPVLRRVAPTWLAQLPWLIEDADRAGLERELRGVTADRMLRELAQALEIVADRAPVVLALEDVHWCDSATADFLAFLARRPSAARILVVATYRPVDAILGDNPIRPVHMELARQNRCRTIDVDALALASIEDIVSRRFDGAAFAPDLARIVGRRSEGNPLFVTSFLDDLVEQGRIDATAGGWQLRGEIREIAGAIPEDLRQMLRAQLDRLAKDEHDVVEAASVAGTTFSSAAAASALGADVVAVEEVCEALARRGVLLDRSGTVAWPDGTSASGYAFRHALYRDTLYDGIPAARRAQLHLRVGERLEAAHGIEVGAVAGVLGMHFEIGGDRLRAARYLRQAAEVAARRGAPREAVALTSRARSHLARVEEGFERTLEELMVEIAAGPALAAINGYAYPEVEEIFASAREHCRALGDGPQLFPILWGLWAFWAVRGRIGHALDLARQCHELAVASDDRDLLLEAHHALWVTHFFRGEIAEAARHVEDGLPLYDRAMHHAHVMLFGQDPGVAAYSYLALIRLAQGRVADSQKASDDGIALARELGHPMSLIFALHFAAWLQEQRGDFTRCRDLAMEVAEIADRNGMPFWLGHATWFASRALAAEDPEAGIAGMLGGIQALSATGARMGVPAYLTTLGRLYLETGNVEEARRLVDEAWATTEESGEQIARTEMLRLRADIESAAGGDGAAERAEKLHREAVELARRQGGAGIELRALLALASTMRTSLNEELLERLKVVLQRMARDSDLPEVASARKLVG